MRFVRYAIILFVAISFFSCTKNEPIKIAMHNWIGYQTLPIALETGAIEQDVLQLIRTSSGSESMRLIKDGAVDAAAITLDEAIQLISQGADLSVVLPFNISAGADVILSKYTLDELMKREKLTIGFEKNALGSLMFAKMLEISELKEEKILIRDVPSNEHKDFWVTHRPDLLITYEPMASYLISTGAKRFMDSRQMQNTIFDVLVVRNSALNQSSKALEKIIKGHYMTIDSAQINQVEFTYQLAQQTKLSNSKVSEILRHLILPNSNYSIDLMKGSPSKLTTITKRLAQLMLKQGLIDSSAEFDSAIKSDLLLDVLQTNDE